jgi:hypothetical protein
MDHSAARVGEVTGIYFDLDSSFPRGLKPGSFADVATWLEGVTEKVTDSVGSGPQALKRWFIFNGVTARMELVPSRS